MSQTQLVSLSHFNENNFDAGHNHPKGISHRFSVNGDNSELRNLSSEEILVLEQNNNWCLDWTKVWVSQNFFPRQIRNSKFAGMIRIYDMNESMIAHKELILPTGIYNSFIINCDIGAYSAIHNVRYLAHFIIGSKVLLSSVDEMNTGKNAKFGNGILKEGEHESQRIKIELCNENGGRSVLPFDSMRSADAFLWSGFKDDDLLQQRLLELTENAFSKYGGYYSQIGDQVVIKNSRVIKDVKVGSYAYIKGVNKLKNITIHSSEDAYTQIGEGCELVNGIIHKGCRIFYGVKAVRFILGENSQLKYGARLINSFLAENSTISCCEVLNSLIFPAHEQHHNNSFLCASLLMGQTNIAAAATIGSNHNSRAADGEIIAGRGFWPGLGVSLKHNSRFAAFTLISKGSYPAEIDLKLPFCMLTNDFSDNSLKIMYGYWFIYNMYGIFRNEWKVKKRNKNKSLKPVFDVLAPDSINEIMDSFQEVAFAAAKSSGYTGIDYLQAGKKLLLKGYLDFEVLAENVENSKRKVIIIKAEKGYRAFIKMVKYYIATVIVEYLKEHSFEDFLKEFNKTLNQKREKFINMGGQLIPENDYLKLVKDIKNQTLRNWEEIHQNYKFWEGNYDQNRFRHALVCLRELESDSEIIFNKIYFSDIIRESVETKKWITESIIKSREKDYTNPFRKMVYKSEKEMLAVMGKMEENEFLMDKKKEEEIYFQSAREILRKM